ncbi:MAG: hypothetical protein WAL75_21395 [Terracidiphilus sp.]
MPAKRDPAVLAQQVPIDRALVITGQDELAGVATLRHVMRHINHSDTGQTRYSSYTIRKRSVCLNG